MWSFGVFAARQQVVDYKDWPKTAEQSSCIVRPWISPPKIQLLRRTDGWTSKTTAKAIMVWNTGVLYLFWPHICDLCRGPGGAKPRHESPDKTSIPKVTLGSALTQLSFGGLIIHENWLKLCFLDLVASRTGSIGGFGGDNSQHVWIMLESQLMTIYENFISLWAQKRHAFMVVSPAIVSYCDGPFIWQGSMAGRDHVYMHTPWVPGPAFGLAKLGFQAGEMAQKWSEYVGMIWRTGSQAPENW